MPATIIISAIIAAVFIAIVVKGIINRKNGKCCCGGCSGCSAKGTCHMNKQNSNNSK